MMKRTLSLLLILGLTTGIMAQKTESRTSLVFDPNAGEERVLTMPDGYQVSYTAYERLFFVTNIEDSAYQTMNVYVPEGATQHSPIFLRTYIGGYMEAAAGQPQAGDATGRALREGFVVAIPGSRGRQSIVIAQKNDKKRGIKKGEAIYTGRAPKALLDLKAAIRYLRMFDKEMPGDAEKIITDGTSAGGAMSALMGATGNHPAYASMLKNMGAADTRDDVFASVCFCPITDLDHADMAYEWLFADTDSRQNASQEVQAVSQELKSQYPDYLESLRLTTPEGRLLHADNYLEYLKKELIRSAQIAKNAGADIPDSIGFVFSADAGFGAPPVNGGMKIGKREAGGRRPGGGIPPFAMPGGAKQAGEYIIDLDMQKYLNYVVSTQPLKTAPAFDTKDVAGQAPSAENEVFGDETGSSENFTEYGCAKNGTALSKELATNVRLMNPMYFIGDSQAAVAPHWYIRHGSRDRDTSFPVSLNLAMKLQDSGKDVNFLLAWNRPHSGDYALDELFQWLRSILE